MSLLYLHYKYLHNLQNTLYKELHFPQLMDIYMKSTVWWEIIST